MRKYSKNELKHHKAVAKIPCNQKSYSTNSMIRYYQIPGGSQVGFNYMKRRTK